MSRIVRTLFLSVIFTLLIGCATGPDSRVDFQTLTPGQLAIALYPGFAPVVFHDPTTGEISGIDVDILRAFADDHGLELSIVEHGFSGIWELPARGEVDIAASGISRLDSRLIEGMVWSEPYYEVQRSLSIRKEDASRLQSITDFGGLAIGFTPGSTGEMDTRQRAPESTRLIGYDIEEEAIADLLSGKINAIARGDVSSLYDASVIPALAVTDLHYFEPREYFVFALPANNTELQNALNEFLAEMKASGGIDKIVKMYLRVD